MSLSVHDLQPGDRVLLNCPKARGETHREARFDGVFASYHDAVTDHASASTMTLHTPATAAFRAAEGGRASAWARFILQTLPPGAATARMPGGEPIELPVSPGMASQLGAVFVVDDDGNMREEEGRRIFIERRLRMGQG